MNIDSASTFLIGSILFAVSCLILAAAATAINNLLHKYWKPVTIFSEDSWTLFGNSASQHYVDNHPEVLAKRTELEKIAPTLTDLPKDKK
jgi:hypothetical protein